MKTLMTGLLLAMSFATQGFATPISDVKGMELLEAVAALEAAGFEASHDGEDGYKTRYFPGTSRFCGKEEIAPSMRRFRKVTEMNPEPPTDINEGATISLVSTWATEQVGKPPECRDANGRVILDP